MAFRVLCEFTWLALSKSLCVSPTLRNDLHAPVSLWFDLTQKRSDLFFLFFFPFKKKCHMSKVCQKQERENGVKFLHQGVCKKTIKQNLQRSHSKKEKESTSRDKNRFISLFFLLHELRLTNNVQDSLNQQEKWSGSTPEKINRSSLSSKVTEQLHTRLSGGPAARCLRSSSHLSKSHFSPHSTKPSLTYFNTSNRLEAQSATQQQAFPPRDQKM